MNICVFFRAFAGAAVSRHHVVSADGTGIRLALEKVDVKLETGTKAGQRFLYHVTA